jgi:hypothetical protein
MMLVETVYICVRWTLGPLRVDGSTVLILWMWFTHFLAETGRGLDLPLSLWEAHFMGHDNGLHHWKRKRTKCNITASKTHAPSVPSHDLYVAERQWILSSAELQKNIFEGLRNNIMNSILSNLEDGYYCSNFFPGRYGLHTPGTWLHPKWYSDKSATFDTPVQLLTSEINLIVQRQNHALEYVLEGTKGKLI